jgi:hypothetical protein
MSRIQEILSKAERDGTARRTRALVDDGPVVAPMANPARPAVDATALRTADTMRPRDATRNSGRREGGVPRPHRSTSISLRRSHLARGRAISSLRTRIKRAENGRAVRGSS